MEVSGLVFGVIPAVLQLYKVAEAAYDFYHDVKGFRSSYQELFLCLEIERFRFKRWGNHTLSESHLEEAKAHPSEMKLFELLDTILKRICDTFSDSAQMMSAYSENTPSGTENRENSITHTDNATEDWRALGSPHLSPKPSNRHAIPGLAKVAKFVLRDRDKLEKLIKKLSYWNDSLDKLTSRLDQESARRQLRTHFSTSDSDQLRRLEIAAALLQHHDIASMASTRRLIEEGNKEELSAEEGSKDSHVDLQYHLDLGDLSEMSDGYRTETNRATAIYRDGPVIIDWRSCRDDTWRKENPEAFRLRTENLAKVLNSDLRPLGLCVLQCVGYLNRGTNLTGYAFRPPPGYGASLKPTSLLDIFKRCRKAEDVAELGERFELAKALVSTVFEIHNLGWMHKNLLPSNILFWPKPGSNQEPNLRKPYIVGFDVSRLNRPDEVSEKPSSGPDDELYRHPEYKGDDPRRFLPSYDMYSLGVMLFEIGMWRTVVAHGSSSQSRAIARPPPWSNPSSSPLSIAHTSHTVDPRYVENVVLNGSVMDLKRYMGIRYRDAVIACLNKDLDALWDDEACDRGEQLRVYLGEVHSMIVEPIAQCNA